MTTPEEQRDNMMSALMNANTALQKVQAAADEHSITEDTDEFIRLIPYHAQIIQDMAEAVFSLPEGERLVPSKLREILYAKRAETLDIYYFEALEQFIAIAFHI